MTVFFRLYDVLKDNKQHCYYIYGMPLTDVELKKVNTLLKIKTLNSTQPDLFSRESKEIGFYMHFPSPWSTNVLSIFKKAGIENIIRIERTTLIHNSVFNKERIDPVLHKIYDKPLVEFPASHNAQRSTIIPYKEIKAFSDNNNLAIDAEDTQYYTHLFRDILKRNPTSMELVDLAQSNSEHSRHWFFNGALYIEKNRGVIEREPNTLMTYIKNPLREHTENSVVAFKDNASAIRTHVAVNDLIPSDPCKPSPFVMKRVKYYPTLNAETHNFPTGISPFPGAATGVGGRIRDTHAIGRGGLITAGMAGYCVGNLFLDRKHHKWETTDPMKQTINGAKMLLEASDGASDYGNKFGEPMIGGFCRSFGMQLNVFEKDDKGERKRVEHYEYIKPIMFSAGVGRVPEASLHKHEGQEGMYIYRVGGPAYRIGLGGGSASSRPQDKTVNDLESVQRGDPEMQNRANRFVKACVELLNENPIVKIHDQGAGGMANVTKEIIEPFGAVVNIDDVVVGDNTMTPFEIWNAEYQEQTSILIKPKDKTLVETIAKRENVPLAMIGTLNKTNKITVTDNANNQHVDLNLSEVLNSNRSKRYTIKPREYVYSALKVPNQETQREHFLTNLSRIFQLVSVGSKSFLTCKVDRTVGSLVVQQQCVGPLDLPLCDYGMTRHTPFTRVGTITAIGEQPVKGITNPKAMIGMAIGEMLLNMVWGVIPNLHHVKCSGNWMWPNCDEYEQYLLYDCVKEVNRIMTRLGIAIDGGKDSLSMFVKDRTIENGIIKSPRSFVVTGYAEVLDVQQRVTPDVKGSGSILVYANLSRNLFRLGGSAYAQIHNCLGGHNQIPSMEDITRFGAFFEVMQLLIIEEYILSGHDVSDGGLITTILEMCFAGNRGCYVNIEAEIGLYDFMFSEELGVVFEIRPKDLDYIMKTLAPVCKLYLLGSVSKQDKVEVVYNKHKVIDMKMTALRCLWEKTSISLMRKQFGDEFADNHYNKVASFYHPVDVNFTIDMLSSQVSMLRERNSKKNVAILRDQGTTGDKEMAVAFHQAGYTCWDITKDEYISLFKDGRTDAGYFDVTAICGGFTYSDVLGGGVGLAENLKITTKQLGICNGCQKELSMAVNTSGRLQSEMVWVGDFTEYGIYKKHKCISVNKTGIVKQSRREHQGVYIFSNSKATGDDGNNNNNNNQQSLPLGKCVGKKTGKGLFLMPHIERMITCNQNESGWIQVFLNL